MAPPTGYDIGLTITDPENTGLLGQGPHGFMVRAHRQQDITPSSARRSDGDTRFQLIPSESFWSQQDWAGGYGRLTPFDPTMYDVGDADTLAGTKVLPAWDWEEWAASTATYEAACAGADGNIYYVWETGGSRSLGAFTPATGGFTVLANGTISSAVTSMVVFRNAVWVAYGVASDVHRYDLTSGALTNPAPAFKAQVLAAYSSMLFYAFYDSTTTTWRLNRYDPENTGAVADLAILPVNNALTDYVRSLVSLGPDLFVVCSDALYKFTSQNGNAGVLVGPVDSWLPVGIGGQSTSGYGAAAFQGALYYGAGGALRRHQPGGGARQVWPVAPNMAGGDQADAALGKVYHPTWLMPVDDRLYVAATHVTTASATTTHGLGLLCWTGAGMHWLFDETVVGASVAQQRAIGAVSAQGALWLAATAALGSPSSGAKVGYFWIRHNATTKLRRRATTLLRTSLLDFGQVDLDKVISQIGLLVSVPSDTGYDFAVTLYALDEGETYPTFVAYPFATATGGYGAWGAPSIVYYTRAASPEFIVGKQFFIEVTITSPVQPQFPPELHAITCIPNPVYPVRYGFRAEIPIGEHVRDHAGERAYLTSAEARDYLLLLRTMREMAYPLELDWVDGQTYTVRVNTITFVREAMRSSPYPNNDEAWVVTLDLQEISG